MRNRKKYTRQEQKDAEELSKFVQAEEMLMSANNEG